MAVKLRLKRTGRRNQPAYKVVAADSRSPRDRRFIEIVGTYNPRVNPAEIKLNEEKAFKWLRRGALPTDTVRSILRKSGLWYKWYLKKKGLEESVVAQKISEWQASQEAKLARDAARKERRKASRKARKAAEAKPAAEGGQPAAAPTPEQPAA